MMMLLGTGCAKLGGDDGAAVSGITGTLSSGAAPAAEGLGVAGVSNYEGFEIRCVLASETPQKFSALVDASGNFTLLPPEFGVPFTCSIYNGSGTLVAEVAVKDGSPSMGSSEGTNSQMKFDATGSMGEIVLDTDKGTAVAQTSTMEGASQAAVDDSILSFTGTWAFNQNSMYQVDSAGAVSAVPAGQGPPAAVYLHFMKGTLNIDAGLGGGSKTVYGMSIWDGGLQSFQSCGSHEGLQNGMTLTEKYVDASGVEQTKTIGTLDLSGQANTLGTYSFADDSNWQSSATANWDLWAPDTYATDHYEGWAQVTNYGDLCSSISVNVNDSAGFTDANVSEFLKQVCYGNAFHDSGARNDASQCYEDRQYNWARSNIDNFHPGSFPTAGDDFGGFVKKTGEPVGRFMIEEVRATGSDSFAVTKKENFLAFGSEEICHDVNGNVVACNDASAAPGCRAWFTHECAVNVTKRIQFKVVDSTTVRGEYTSTGVLDRSATQSGTTQYNAYCGDGMGGWTEHTFTSTDNVTYCTDPGSEINQREIMEERMFFELNKQ
jgi:hypothetical protein